MSACIDLIIHDHKFFAKLQLKVHNQTQFYVNWIARSKVCFQYFLRLVFKP